MATDEATTLTKSAAMSGVILSMNSASVPALAASLYDAISYYSNMTHTHTAVQATSHHHMQAPTHIHNTFTQKYTHACIHTYKHTYTHIHTYINTVTHTYMHTYVHTNHRAGFSKRFKICVTKLKHHTTLWYHKMKLLLYQ